MENSSGAVTLNNNSATVRAKRSIRIKLAYGFFELLAIAWIFVSIRDGKSSGIAAFIVAVASAALYYLNLKFAHLIAGIVFLFFSFFMFMQTLNTVMVMGGHGTVFTVSAFAFVVCCISASTLLIVEFYKQFLKQLDH